MRSYRCVFCLFLLLLLLIQCDKADPDRVVPQDEIIKLEFDSDITDIKADYTEVIALKAIVTPTAKQDFRTITFIASEGLGTFEGTVVDKKNVVLADNTGIARTSLVVGNKPGNYYISAEIKGDNKTFRTKDHLIVVKAVSQDDLIRLTFESDTTGLRSDQISTIKLKASVPQGAPESMKSITFNMTAGLGDFQGTSANNSTTVLADSEGHARTNVKVGNTPGTFFISASAKDGEKIFRTKDFAITLAKIPDVDKMEVLVDNLSPEADGATILSVSIRTRYTNEKTVSLQANSGAFLEATTDPLKVTVVLDNQGNGSTRFQISNNVKAHVLTVNLAQVAPLTLILRPTVSWPDVIRIEPSTLLYDTIGGLVKLDVVLKRNEGNRKVSVGREVRFSAYQLDDGIRKGVGRFIGVNQASSDQEGKLSVQFVGDTKNFNSALPVNVDIATLKNSSELITETIQLHLRRN